MFKFFFIIFKVRKQQNRNLLKCFFFVNLSKFFALSLQYGGFEYFRERKELLMFMTRWIIIFLEGCFSRSEVKTLRTQYPSKQAFVSVPIK